LQQAAWQFALPLLQQPLSQVQCPFEQSVQVQFWQVQLAHAQLVALAIILSFAFAEPPIDTESISTAMLAKMIFFILFELMI